MVNQLKGLENTKSNLSTKYFYLLEVCCLDDKNNGLIFWMYIKTSNKEMLYLINLSFIYFQSLALVKSFNICLEMDFQDIILQLFKMFFQVVK